MKHIIFFLICLVSSRSAPVLEGNNKETEDVSGKQQDTLQVLTFEELKQINKNCMEESGVDKKIISTVLKTAVVPNKDPKYMKFLACSYKKQKYINEKGKIQFQNIKKFLSKYYSMENLRVLDICEGLKQTENAGENAFNVLECILPKLVLLKEIADE